MRKKAPEITGEPKSHVITMNHQLLLVDAYESV